MNYEKKQETARLEPNKPTLSFLIDLILVELERYNDCNNEFKKLLSLLDKYPEESDINQCQSTPDETVISKLQTIQQILNTLNRDNHNNIMHLGNLL